MCHFNPGVLGKCMSEREKQIVIIKNYGDIVFSEYKRNHRLNIVKEPIPKSPSSNSKF